ncbi:helix-turn-helix domain-containing protein [Planctomycetota bacterium]
MGFAIHFNIVLDIGSLFAVTTRAWDLEFTQLDKGDFVGSLQQFGQADFLVGHANFSRALLQRGSAPAGLRTFVIPTESCSPLNWRRYRVGPGSLLVYANSRDWESISCPGFDIHTLSFSEAYLNEVCNDLELPEFQILAQQAEVVHGQPHDMRLLQRYLRESMQRVAGFEQGSHPVFPKALQRELATITVSMLAQPTSPKIIPPLRLRDRAVRRAIDYIHESGHVSISSSDLCRIAKASERTLEYGFRERLGMTPRAFLLKHRLNRVRKQLRLGDPATIKIVNIANQWGFWHMGQFAADYRKLFGELPSETLQRNQI